MIPASNVKDLMLRKDVVAAVKEGRFHVYAVKTVEDGLGILTGIPAGEKGPDGTYPEDTLNARVDRKLKILAEGLKKYAGTENADEKKKGGPDSL
jgi:predicted ATP-dependent protease